MAFGDLFLITTLKPRHRRGFFFIAVGLPDGLAVLVESAAADDALMDQALG